MWRKTRQIRVEREHHREREDPCQKRKEERSEKVIADSEKISADLSGASNVVYNDGYRGEDPIIEGRQTMAAKYTRRWKIMR